MPLTEEQFNKWIEELESGEHDQCTGSLRENIEERTNYTADPRRAVGYCCLGLAAEKVLGWTYRSAGMFEYTDSESGLKQTTCGVLPDHVINQEVQRALATMNDGGDVMDANGNLETSRSHTFAEIAETLREKGLAWLNGDRV